MLSLGNSHVVYSLIPCLNPGSIMLIIQEQDVLAYSMFYLLKRAIGSSVNYMTRLGFSSALGTAPILQLL